MSLEINRRVNEKLRADWRLAEDTLRLGAPSASQVKLKVTPTWPPWDGSRE